MTDPASTAQRLEDSVRALAESLAAERARAEGLRSGYHERGRRITELEAELGELRRRLRVAEDLLGSNLGRVVAALRLLNDVAGPSTGETT